MADAFQPKFVDLVRNYTTTVGTGDFVLSAAVNGFSSFTETCQAGDSFYYAATGVDKPAEREVGRGTLGSNGTIARDPISGIKTNFSSGTKSVALVAASEWFTEMHGLRATAGPTNVKSFGAKGDSDRNGLTGTDDTAAIQAALDYVDSIGGGALYFPEGHYKVSSCLTVHPKTRIRGAGKAASSIVSGHPGAPGATAGDTAASGSGLRTISPLNSSANIYVAIEDIGIRNGNAANVGAAYYDTCGTTIALHNTALSGFKYGIILDQSELVDIDLCEIGEQNAGGAAVWIVNGDDLSPGAIKGFTNRISVTRCQINESGATYGIVDDGGYVHVLAYNNYNGCLNHIRACGAVSLLIDGGEFEGAASHCIALSVFNVAGAVIGGSYVGVRGGSFNVTPGASAINGSGAPGLLEVSGYPSFTGGSGDPPITGANVFAAINLTSYSNQSFSPAAVKDGIAEYVDVDLMGGVVNGVTMISGKVTAANIGSAAAHAETDFLLASNNLSDVTDKIAAAKNLGGSVVLNQSGAAVSHSGDTNEFTFASVTVPANSMGANGRVEVKARFTLTNTAASKTTTLKFGGTSFAAKATANAALVSMEADIANRNSAASQTGSGSFLTGTTVNNNGPTTAAIDTTRDQTLAITGQLTSATDTITLESCQFILYPEG